MKIKFITLCWIIMQVAFLHQKIKTKQTKPKKTNKKTKKKIKKNHKLLNRLRIPNLIINLGRKCSTRCFLGRNSFIWVSSIWVRRGGD